MISEIEENIAIAKSNGTLVPVKNRWVNVIITTPHAEFHREWEYLYSSGASYWELVSVQRFTKGIWPFTKDMGHFHLRRPRFQGIDDIENPEVIDY